MNQDVRNEEGPTKGRYVVIVDGHEAEMTYSRAGDAMIIIDHTHVPDALRGRHIGEMLVRKAVEDARAAGKSIIPLCPFAKAQIARAIRNGRTCCRGPSRPRRSHKKSPAVFCPAGLLFCRRPRRRRTASARE